MIIKTAEFVISNTDVAKCPDGDKPEYAFIGRSNVGKSSLINSLTGRKGLAKTSATPGKTLLFNQQRLVSGGFARVWICKQGQGTTRRVGTNHKELYLAAPTDGKLVPVDRFTSQATKDRP